MCDQKFDLLKHTYMGKIKKPIEMLRGYKVVLVMLHEFELISFSLKVFLTNFN